jgi:hypothetical protein
MSRIDIADYLGVTVETISRALAKLRECGVIAIPNVHELVIIDLPRLEALAHGALPAESRRRRTARHLGSADTRTCSGPVIPPLSDRPEFDENLTSVN